MVSPDIVNVIQLFCHPRVLLAGIQKSDWIRRCIQACPLTRSEGRRMTVLIFFLISPTFATTSHNLYDAKGNMIASCGEKGCEYFIYQGVSRVGVVKNHQFNHQNNGLDGKAGEMVHDQSGIISSQLWIPDFHGSVIAKLTKPGSDSILFDAFGSVLNESTNTEGCKDYHYTDKPRVGCTSLHNFNARFYDPKIGRFITTDPIEQHNLNWFIYVNNNPLSFVDSSGKAKRSTTPPTTEDHSTEQQTPNAEDYARELVRLADTVTDNNAILRDIGAEVSGQPNPWNTMTARISREKKLELLREAKPKRDRAMLEIDRKLQEYFDNGGTADALKDAINKEAKNNPKFVTLYAGGKLYIAFPEMGPRTATQGKLDASVSETEPRPIQNTPGQSTPIIEGQPGGPGFFPLVPMYRGGGGGTVSPGYAAD